MDTLVKLRENSEIESFLKPPLEVLELLESHMFLIKIGVLTHPYSSILVLKKEGLRVKKV